MGKREVKTEGATAEAGASTAAAEVTTMDRTAVAKASAEAVMAYAVSKELRGGWGVVSEAMTIDELTEELVKAEAFTKTKAMVWARSLVKTKREAEKEVKAAA